MEDQFKAIEDWLKPELDKRNLFLVDVKIGQNKKIQVFVDGEQNIKIDELAQISRYLESMLDESDSVPEDYNLEVSSPGMGNPLKVPQQYRKRIGRVLEITLENGDYIEAQLVDSSGENITVKELVKPDKKSKNKSKKKELVTKEESMTIPYEQIKKAYLQINF